MKYKIQLTRTGDSWSDVSHYKGRLYTSEEADTIIAHLEEVKRVTNQNMRQYYDDEGNLREAPARVRIDYMFRKTAIKENGDKSLLELTRSS